jgi:hypothetical protein
LDRERERHQQQEQQGIIVSFLIIIIIIIVIDPIFIPINPSIMVHIINTILEMTSTGYRNLRYIFVDDDDTEDFTNTNNNNEEHTSLTRGAGFRNFARSNSAIRVCIFHGLCYYALAILGFSVLVEKWSILDSVYFATVVFTTM